MSLTRKVIILYKKKIFVTTPDSVSIHHQHAQIGKNVISARKIYARSQKFLSTRAALYLISVYKNLKTRNFSKKIEKKNTRGCLRTCGRQQSNRLG